jgi:predicted nuclease of restriction endonuclease-like (RecB) superfamily
MKFNGLTQAIHHVHNVSQSKVGRVVNQSMNLRNWLIGAYIIEYEQGGEDRAEYGEGLIREISKRLKAEGVKGLGEANLKNFRQIARCWPQLAIRQTASGELGAVFEGIENLSNFSEFMEFLKVDQIGQTLSGQFGEKVQGPVSAEFHFLKERARNHQGLEWQNSTWIAKLFGVLSFSHLLELSRLDDPLERAFYEIECMKSGWSVRELKRQRDSMLFQRVGLSKDKDAVMALAKKGRLVDLPDTIFRDPMVLEFLGLEQRVVYAEPDLEKAILDHLEAFMRELGRDFCFVDRQLPIRVGSEVFHLDLVFFHRGLRCLVAIDLKVGRFQHTDAGQMNFYLNYIREQLTKPDEQPPIGLLLCTDKDEETVYFATGGMENDIRVSRYKLELPSEAELKAFLQRERQFIEEQQVTKKKGS